MPMTDHERINTLEEMMFLVISVLDDIDWDGRPHVPRLVALKNIYNQKIRELASADGAVEK